MVLLLLEILWVLVLPVDHFFATFVQIIVVRAVIGMLTALRWHALGVHFGEVGPIYQLLLLVELETP